MDLIKLQNEIHAQNVELGWWDEERPYEVFACLFHSELSEAMEGDRKGLMDDHLPLYEMFWVEVADFVIRVLDYLGSVDNRYFLRAVGMYDSKHIMLCDMHEFVCFSSREYSNFRKSALRNAVSECMNYAKQNNIYLYKIILEKVAYNKTRADHKRKNRAKVGGKRY